VPGFSMLHNEVRGKRGDKSVEPPPAIR